MYILPKAPRARALALLASTIISLTGDNASRARATDPAMPPKLIKLNVGGTIFTTTETTLTKESRYFAALLSGDYSDRDGDDVFVDRDPAHFAVVLQYLRGGLASVPPELTAAGILAEAEFFLVDGLMAAMHEQLRPTTTEQPTIKADQPHVSFGGCYVRRVAADPTQTEALRFIVPGTAGVDRSAVSSAAGTVVYSRGVQAPENVLALANMPSPMPRIWTHCAEATSLIAQWTPNYVTRGTFQCEGGALLVKRGMLALQPGGESNASSQASVHTMVGLLARDGSLLIMEDGGPDGSGGMSGLLSGVGIGVAQPLPLNGGFRQFVYEGP